MGFFGRYSERSLTKCVGITIETRPDYCLKRHLSDMLSYGCTRLEIGVQSVYEDVARDTNRWEESFSAKLSVAARCTLSGIFLSSVSWPVCLNTHLTLNVETCSSFPCLCGHMSVTAVATWISLWYCVDHGLRKWSYLWCFILNSYIFLYCAPLLFIAS